MTSLEYLAGTVAIHPRGDQLLVPKDLDRISIDWIREHKDVITPALKGEQTDEAGFYIALPEALRAELMRAPWLLLYSESTTVTPFSRPIRISKYSRIGQLAFPAYRSLHPGTCPSTAARVRVVTVHTPELGTEFRCRCPLNFG